MASVSVGKPVTQTGNPEVCQQALERLIEQEIIWKEIELSEFVYAPVTGDNTMQNAIKNKAGGEAKLSALLAYFGMMEMEWESFLTRQETIAAYIKDQFNPVVFVAPEEIEEFYKNEYLSTQILGQEIRPVSELEEEISQILRQRKINQELVEWLERRKTELNVHYIGHR